MSDVNACYTHVAIDSLEIGEAMAQAALQLPGVLSAQARLSPLTFTPVFSISFRYVGPKDDPVVFEAMRGFVQGLHVLVKRAAP